MKTKLIALTLTAVLAAALVSLTACGSSDTASVAESATSETASAATSDITSAIGETATDTESTAESTAETTTQTATEQPATQPAMPVQVSAGATAQQPQTTAPATPAPQNHAPLYRQQWVVDKAAWTEEQPVYQQKAVDICNNCGADVTENPGAHGQEHALKGEGGGHHTELRQVQTGTKTIYHEEQGHHESVLICAGCTGTH